MAIDVTPKTKKLADVNESTKESEKVFENMPALPSVQNIQNEAYTQPAKQTTSGLIYGPSLHDKLQKSKKSNKFLETKEALESDKTRKCKEIKKVIGTRIAIKTSEYIKSTDIQEVFTNTSGAPVQKLSIEEKVGFSKHFKKISVIKIIHHNAEKNQAVLLILSTISILM